MTNAACEKCEVARKALAWGLLLALVMSALMLAGCKKRPPEAAATVGSEGQFNVERLFTHEGCTLYRFRDGDYVYYARCRGQETTSTFVECSETSGKTMRYWPCLVTVEVYNPEVE